MKKILFSIFVTLFLGVALSVHAHQPIVIMDSFNAELGRALPLENATLVPDPTQTSVAIYDSLSEPNEVNIYSFQTSVATTIPIEALVPVRIGNKNFRPWIAVIGTNLEGNRLSSPDSLLFSVPEQYHTMIIPPVFGDREVYLEEYSRERLFEGKEELVSLALDSIYYIAVFNPDGVVGDYVIGAGTAENFSSVNSKELTKQIIKIKFGIIGNREISISNFVYLNILSLGFAITAGLSILLLLMIVLGYFRHWWIALSLRTQSFLAFVMFGGIVIQVIGSALLYKDVGFTSLAPITAISQALAAGVAVYLAVVSKRYRWVVVDYERMQKFVFMWKWRTIVALIILLTLSFCSFKTSLWYALFLA